MTAKQHIFRVRRNYNQWVANQTLEDYALRFTAKSARRWSRARVATTALGAISFLALEAIGGAITLHYGFTNAAAAICAVGLIIFLTAIPISYYAAKYGVDIDLLTRGAGFGYIGSTITSLIDQIEKLRLPINCPRTYQGPYLGLITLADLDTIFYWLLLQCRAGTTYQQQQFMMGLLVCVFHPYSAVHLAIAHWL